jgi:hypothetical protein
MLQSGMLIPVHERSETFFIRILTDIGDKIYWKSSKYIQLPIKEHELLLEEV